MNSVPQQNLIEYSEDQAREIDREQAEANRERFGVPSDEQVRHALRINGVEAVELVEVSEGVYRIVERERS